MSALVAREHIACLSSVNNICKGYVDNRIKKEGKSRMAIVPKSTKVLVPYREPADMTIIVNKTTENLLEISKCKYF